jgi:hypothetical protein
VTVPPPRLGGPFDGTAQFATGWARQPTSEFGLPPFPGPAAPPHAPRRRSGAVVAALGFVGVRRGLPFGEVKVFDDGRVLVVAPSTAAGGDLTVSASFPVGG